MASSGGSQKEIQKDSQNLKQIGAGRPRGRPEADLSLKRKRGMFNKEIRLMMYGFGDNPDPLPESIELVEDIVIDYVTDMIHKAQDVAALRGKLTTSDILFLIRKDPRKFARVKELLAMNEELKNARKAFDIDGDKFGDGS